MAGYESHATPLPPANYYFDLGTFGRTVTTESPAAQTWFNRGFNWTYAFNHEEACLCFEQVIAHDPECAMGYWGVAFASGPNYNKTWGAFDEKDLKASWHKCYYASRRAIQLSGTATALEKALIDALQYRFPVDYAPEDLHGPNVAYANAMRDVYREYKDDLDVVTLFAEASMDTAPRKMFHQTNGKPIPTSPVFEVKEVLERGLLLPGARTHPGVLHMNIHFMEMSATPEAAIPAADDLRDLIPDGGHMYHMPAHLYVLAGEYRRSVDCNYRATIADDKFYAIRGGKTFYSYYRLHDYHSLIYAAMLTGQSQLAIDSCTRMEATITEDLLKHESPPLARFMEFFLAVRVHVYIRFGMWEELTKLDIPQDQDLYCVTTAMRHYGKGIAWGVLENLEEADRERDLFRAAAKRVPPSRLDFPNRIVDVLKVATAMLDGEIEYRRQNYDAAFRSLREAIVHDDALLYTEPWGWMLPTRHSFAALSLEQGNVEDAAQAYAEDLGLDESITRAHQHPNNVWALHGYHECLIQLGRKAEARIIKKQLTLAMAIADVPIQSSCFCRLHTCCKS